MADPSSVPLGRLEAQLKDKVRKLTFTAQVSSEDFDIIIPTVKEEIFASERSCTFNFPCKTIRMVIQCVGFWDDRTCSRLEPSRGGLPLSTEENLVWNLIKHFFNYTKATELR